MMQPSCRVVVELFQHLDDIATTYYVTASRAERKRALVVPLHQCLLACLQLGMQSPYGVVATSFKTAADATETAELRLQTAETCVAYSKKMESLRH